MIYALIVILLISLGLYVLINGKKLNFRRPPTPRPKPHYHAVSLSGEQIKDRWKSIAEAAEGGEHSLRTAIADADKLLDQVMRQRGFAGDTMAERLKKAEDRFADKEAIWSAHKLRNALAHDVNYDLVMTRGRQAVDDIHRGLKDLGVL